MTATLPVDQTPLQETPVEQFQARRARLAAQMQAGSIAIIPSAPEQVRNADAHFPYRADSYFYYLTGFEEPNAWLLLSADGHTTLLCQAKNPEREMWDGYRLGPQAAPQALALDAAFAVEELDARLPDLLQNRSAVYYPFMRHAALAPQIAHWLGQVRSRARTGVTCPDQLHDVCSLLDDMRLIKDAFEIAHMRRAGVISAQAHIRAMQRSAQMLKRQEAVCEYHLEAELLHEFRQHGSESPAYTSIVAAGANACVLHYRAGNAPVQAGDLVLIDAGCELRNYASDITRTFPANGKFTPAQKQIYEIVLAAHAAAIAAAKPGARFNDVHEAALAVLVQGLFTVGILRTAQHGSVADALASKAYSPYYMHRTSHWLGLDVHDVGRYSEGADPNASRVLHAGMVLTIEPGLYIRPAPEVPIEFHNIGIRIEDDALITADGCEIYTSGAPVQVADIERLMAAG